MQTQQIIKCAFCYGCGTNPFYKGTCPVCKGRGKIEVVIPYISCTECRGSGKKSGTTLTCFTCRGLGVVPDTREVIKTAREEIKEIQKEMEEERNELYGKTSKKVYPERSRRVEAKMERKKRQDEFDEIAEVREDSGGRYFCQSCAKEIPLSSTYKVCEQCFFLYKFGEVRSEKEKENEG